MRPIGAFHVRAPYHLIQGIRLVHALMESSYRVHVPSEHADKFSRLREVFGLDFAIGIDAIPALPSVALSHREPLTSIGSLQRPLIFPRAIPERCRELWSDNRSMRFSFARLDDRQTARRAQRNGHAAQPRRARGGSAAGVANRSTSAASPNNSRSSNEID